MSQHEVIPHTLGLRSSSCPYHSCPYVIAHVPVLCALHVYAPAGQTSTASVAMCSEYELHSVDRAGLGWCDDVQSQSAKSVGQT